MIQVFQYFIFSKQNRLTEALSEPVESLFEAAENDAWTSIRALYDRETGAAISSFSNAISGFELDEEKEKRMMNDLREFAAGIVKKTAREEAGNILIRMKDR